jgi:hypothetical protein
MVGLITSLEGGVKEGVACGCGSTAERGVRRGGEAKRLEVEDGPNMWGPPVGDRKERREGGRWNGPAGLTGRAVRGKERGREGGEMGRDGWKERKGEKGGVGWEKYSFSFFSFFNRVLQLYCFARPF